MMAGRVAPALDLVGAPGPETTFLVKALTVRAEVKRSFFDTNVLVYLYDDDTPEKQSTAMRVFEREIEADRAT